MIYTLSLYTSSYLYSYSHSKFLSDLSPFRDNLFELDQFLGPYPFDDSLRRWLSMTSYINNNVIESLQPLNKCICSVSTYVQQEEPDEDEKGLKQQQENFAKIAEETDMDTDSTNPKSGMVIFDSIIGTDIVKIRL